ncbi:hypothetical protein WG922_09520 [Ramlibacter sp. AN1015]|uniref:hypothetical protein n=1 Tax=Ramlibacter sp. AN1015 TaxID=3133428 RepID=UPI0030BC1D4C
MDRVGAAASPHQEGHRAPLDLTQAGIRAAFYAGLDQVSVRTKCQDRAFPRTVHLCRAIAAAAIVVAAATWVQGAVAQAAPQAQTSEAAGVKITVTPRVPAGTNWTFTVVMDTHTGDLQDDLREAAVLVVDGTELRPVQWTAPSGGHHREGELSFSVPGAQRGPIELRISRPGEPQPRVFHWDGTSFQ